MMRQEGGAALWKTKAQVAEKLSAKAKAALAKGKAAVAKHKERKLNEQERKLNEQERKLNARRMAAPGKLKERWRSQSAGHGGGHGQPALAGVSGGQGGGTKAIGKPSLI